MAATLVQHAEAGATSAALAVTVAHPSTGNLLIAWANSNNVVATPTDNGSNSGWTAGPSVVDGNGTYMWYRTATATDAANMTTVTLTPGASDRIHAGVGEWSGVAGFDVQATATASGVSTSTAAPITTTGASGDLVFTIIAMHGSSASLPSAPSWTNSYTNVVPSPPSSGGLTASDCYTWLAWLNQSAAGATSTVCTWTTNEADDQSLIISFKLSAPAATSPAPAVTSPAFRVAAGPRFVPVVALGSTGGVTVTGTGTGAITFDGSGVGTVTVIGTGAGAISFAGSGVALVTTTTTGTGAVSFAGAGIATVTVTGTGTGNLTFAGSGVASTSGAVSATGTGAVTFAGSGTATVTVTGTGSAAIVFGGSGTATVTTTTAGTGAVTFAGAGTATTSGAVSATGTGPISFAGAASASVSVTTTGVGAIGFIGLGGGTVGLSTGGTGAVTFAGVGTINATGLFTVGVLAATASVPTAVATADTPTAALAAATGQASLSAITTPVGTVAGSDSRTGGPA